nr:hypothetical protein [Bacteroides xylanisolvens]
MFNPRLTHTAALQKISEATATDWNRNDELLLDIMSNMNVESVSFCLKTL